MTPTTTLAELLARGIVLAPNEAVAIAQQLIRACAASSPHAPRRAPEPLSLEAVHISADGTVGCPGYAATPAVSEIAVVLDALAPAGTPNAPGGLRYAIARALLEVDAPPFDSLAEFSTTLCRFEQGDRILVVRTLARRAGLTPGAPAPRRSVARDRRLPGTIARDRAIPAVKRVPAVAVGLVAGLSLIGVGEAMHLLNAPVHAVLHRITTPEATHRASAGAPATPPAPVPSGAPDIAAKPAAASVGPAAPTSSAAPRPRRRRTVKMARADEPAGGYGGRARATSRRDAEPRAFFGVRFKWGGDTFAHRD